MAPRPVHQRALLAGLLAAVVAATAAAYAPSLGGEFQFDDEPAIQRNPAIRSLERFASPAAWDLPARPLTALTLALDYRAGALDPRGYHLVNLLIHLAAVGLAFLLARRALAAADVPSPGPAAVVVAGLFALHPLQTESVSYVIQRAESLASLCFLAALLLLLRAEEAPARGRAAVAWLAALAAAWAGLAAKPVAVTIPLAFLLFGQAFGREAGWPGLRRRLVLAAPLLALSALATWQGLRATAGTTDAGLGVPGLPLADALLTQPRVVVRYLGLLALPIGQTVDHGVLPSRSLAEPATLLALAALAALLGASAWLLSRDRPRTPAPSRWPLAWRAAGFGVAWFALLLLPSSLVPLADPLAEHRVYLASWGIFLGAVALAEAALEGRLKGPARGALAAGLLALLGLLTWHRAGAWETRVSLWSAAVEVTPERARPHQNLGYAWLVRGEHERAVAEFRAALAAGPDPLLQAEILRNLGSALAQLGRHGEAGQALLAAARHPGVEASARALHATSLVELGLLGPARQEAARALQLDPDSVTARNTLGQILLGTGDPAGAAEQFRLAIRLDPDAPVQHFNLALALGRLGRAPEACAAWQRYAGLEPDARLVARRWPEVRAFGCAMR